MKRETIAQRYNFSEKEQGYKDTKTTTITNLETYL